MFKWIFKIIKWIFGIWNNLDKDTKDAILKVLLKIWEWIFGSFYDQKKEEEKNKSEEKEKSNDKKETKNENS